MDKKYYRQKAKEIRAKLDISTISEIITDKIRGLTFYMTAKNVMLYYPKDNELNLLSLADDNKVFYLPRLDGPNMLACPWKMGDKLTLSKYNILEPCTSPVDVDEIDLIIMPGLCADKNKNRLGYGKGCYDFFLETGRARTVFALPDELVFEILPFEEHDKKVDIIVTEKQVIF